MLYTLSRKGAILFATVGFFLIWPSCSRAATEFVATVQASGGDYASLSAWESGLSSGTIDLTAVTTKVFSHSGVTGSITDGASVSGVSSGATATAVHTTASQILLKSISGTFVAGEQVRVDASNYVTITNAGDSVIAIAKIDGTWSSEDTSAVTVDGWTTSATNYIRIYTTTTARHSGLYSTSAYRLGATPSSNVILDIKEEYVRVDGLQFSYAIRFSAGTDDVVLYQPAGVGELQISNVIIRATGSNTGTIVHGIRLAGASAIAKIWNTTIHDIYVDDGVAKRGIKVDSGTAYIYHTTLYNCKTFVSGTANTTVKNSVGVGGSGANFGWTGTFNAASDYNTSSLAANTTGGAHDQSSVTPTFMNVAGKDFHLMSTDTIAKDVGPSLSGDGNLAISTDIDLASRSGSFDLGADEVVAPNAPSSLGPSTLAQGGWVASTTPYFTFTLSDSDSGDTVKYQIQIDDTSNFSSAVVDYTSALAAQGSPAFTIGQAAGSGTYTTGSEGQVLAEGSYYWRVRAYDASGSLSSYTAANSGSVAFQNDLTAPTPTTPSFAGAPSSTTPHTADMTATISSDAGVGSVLYSFEEITGRQGATASGWQASTGYSDTGLIPCTTYTYRYRVQDTLGNTGNFSNALSVQTICLGGGAPLGGTVQLPSSGAFYQAPVVESPPQASPISTPVIIRHDGALIQYRGDARIYQLDKGLKRHIVNERSFIALGYRWDDVMVIDDSEAYPDGRSIELLSLDQGMLIRYPGSSDVYLRIGSIKYLVRPSIIQSTPSLERSIVEVPLDMQYRTGVPIEILGTPLVRGVDYGSTDTPPSTLKRFSCLGDRPLRYGDEGSDVLALQKELQKETYLDTASATGYFGPKTRQAVRRFQQAHGLPSVGRVGPRTYEILRIGIGNSCRE